jgi:hypothetical protein
MEGSFYAVQGFAIWFAGSVSGGGSAKQANTGYSIAKLSFPSWPFAAATEWLRCPRRRVVSLLVSAVKQRQG